MSTRTPSLGLLVVVVLLLAVATARGDRVVLRNGSSLLGKIVGEDRSEIQLELEDGMRMAIRRSQIERIEREDAPEPESEPETEPETGGGTEPNAPTRPATAPEPGNPAAPAFFERSPGIAWDLDYGRYPTVLAAKLSRFRAYDLAEMNPLAVSPTDGRFAPIVREHGHGGFLAAWTFSYVGMEDIRFGDQVKFVGELTSPDDPEMCLLRLQAGPSPTASRLSVILIRRDAETLRFVTPDTFDGTDFKQRDLVDLPNRALPVRTFDPTFRLITEQWVLPARSAIFSGIGAPFVAGHHGPATELTAR